MSVRKSADLLLEHLMGVFSIKGLSFNKDNECILTIDSKIVFLFYLDENAGALLLNAVVDTIDFDSSASKKIYYELLCGNYNWAYSAGGTLGIDKNTGILTLCYRYTLPIAPQVFTDSLARVASAVEHWMKRIEELER
ncbi:MAG: CesT family type III secretion system chaperone [Desulfovibrionaceae bacterium]